MARWFSKKVWLILLDTNISLWWSSFFHKLQSKIKEFRKKENVNNKCSTCAWDGTHMVFPCKLYICAVLCLYSAQSPHTPFHDRETVLTLMIISVSTVLLTLYVQYTWVCVAFNVQWTVEQVQQFSNDRTNDIMFVIAKVILSGFLWGIPHFFLNTIYLHSHYVAIIHYDDISVSSWNSISQASPGLLNWIISIHIRRWNVMEQRAEWK